MNQQHYFQSQRTDDEQHLGSSHSRAAEKTKHHIRTTVNAKPSHDAIAKRAYHLFLKQGCVPGHEVENWLAAEAELMTA